MIVFDDVVMVMPNHVHGLIINVGAQFIAPWNRSRNPFAGTREGAINRAPTLGETCVPKTKGKDFFSLMC